MKFRSARLRALRERQALTPGQLAYKAGISRDYVYLLEKDERPNVSGVIVAEIACALETSSDYLYGLTDDPRPLAMVQSPESQELVIQIGGLMGDPDMEQLFRLILEMTPEQRVSIRALALFLVGHHNL